MKTFLLKAWLSRSWAACLMWPLAQIYGLLVRMRRGLYQRGILASIRFHVPVVVVGNVIVGGAGKTPLVMALVRHLQGQGIRVGVVSRGYGRSGQESLEVTPTTAVDRSGDEPALILQATGAPVFVANRRVDALHALLTAYPDTAVVICDDGLQHYALERDIEIVAFDDRGIGNGWLLPAGPLRESWPERRSQGVNLVLHTGQQPAFKGFTSRRRLARHAVTADGSLIDLTTLKNKPVTALAGIASPEGFFAMLRSEGLRLENTISLPDHHAFKAGELAASAGKTVLCTEKDAVKLFALPDHGVVQLLAVALEFSPEPAFFKAFDVLLTPLLSHLTSQDGHQTTRTAGLPSDQRPS